MRQIILLICVLIGSKLYGQATDNIGVGLLNPQATLHVRHNGTANNILSLYNLDNFPQINIKSSGRLGVNTHFPDAELHVYTQLETPLLAFVEPIKTQPIVMNFSNTSGRAWQISSLVPSGGAFPDGRIKINYVNTGNILTVRGNGTVGIRNENPTSALDIAGNLSVTKALMPNGLAGNPGDVLKSLGTAQAPVWVSPVTIENESHSLSNVSNNGKIGGVGSGYNQTALVSVKSFVLNTNAKIQSNFGLSVQAYESGNGYGVLRMELWQQSSNTLIDTHKHFFKIYGANTSWYDNVNVNKIFNVIHPSPNLNETYEIRVYLTHLHDSPIAYGGQPSGVFLAKPFENFFDIKLYTE
jgi:hypothetical protein